MKLWTIFWFELTYQVRRAPTWIYVAVLALFGFAQTVGGQLPLARSGGYFLNAPFVIAEVTTFCCLIWLLVAAYVAGDAAARDVETGMHPLSYSAPVSRSEYLGGRFAAAFVLNAVILLAVTAGMWLGLHAPEVEVGVRGPFRPIDYISAYTFIALPNAVLGTAVQFSFSTLGRRAVLSYVGAVLLLVTTLLVSAAVGLLLEQDVGWLFDPTGIVSMGDITSGWTLMELNTRRIALEGTLLANRTLWIGFALGILAFTRLRFRFRHPTAAPWWSRIARRRDAASPAPESVGALAAKPICVPHVQRKFDFQARAGQTIAIGWTAFTKIVASPTSLILLTIVLLFALAGILDPELTGVPGVNVLPRTDYVLFGLWNPGFPPGYLILPVLIVYWSGELVWREREARLSEMLDAAPVPDWALFLGKLFGLGLLLAACMAIRMAVGIFVQVAGGAEIGFGAYVQLLFGIQLTDSLLQGLLALVVHAVVNQKHVGHVVAIVAVVLGGVGTQLGIDDLLAYGHAPMWIYTEMRGFGASLEPWLWYKSYWAAWALLLAVVAGLLWARGAEGGLGARFRIALRRFNGPIGLTTIAAITLAFALGRVIFYNTNSLTARESDTEQTERLANYERRYGRFAGVPQPLLTETSLEVAIYPESRRVEARGTYRLVNVHEESIDSVHIALPPEVETVRMALDRSAVLALEDVHLDHRIYALNEPLQPGDSLGLEFHIRYEPRGFPDSDVDASVVANGTLIQNQDWLPAVGYQRHRELRSAAVRQSLGLPSRPAIPSLYDVEARSYVSWAGQRTNFEAVVGTAGNQVAIAPGTLRERWTEDGRNYFRYSTNAAIENQYAIASAGYAVRAAEWNDVEIQIFHHPSHTAHLDKTMEGVRASLNHYTHQFGPYPYNFIRFIEQAGVGFGLHAEAGTITYREWFTLMHPRSDPGSADVPFAVVAHEVGHQWWGAQLGYALVEGAGVLSESLAWYSAIGVVEEALGRAEMRRLMRWMRRPYPDEPVNVPLLRAVGDYLVYRKGPFAMFAMREYLGPDRVNLALRRLLGAHRSGDSPQPTTLDLYRELREVTPDSLRYLLRDLFEANTFWSLDTERATVRQTDDGAWQVTLDIQARKVVVDTAGNETEVPMDDLIQVGVFAPRAEREMLGDPLYLEMHRISSGHQTITLIVPTQPGSAGVDPHHLLIEAQADDNIEVVQMGT